MQWLACVLVITVAACGSTRPKTDPDGDGDDADTPFAEDKDFKPKAFSVEVSNKGGRPIIFIPGLGCPGDAWNETVELLGEDYESHVLTLAGFAGTKPIKQPLSAAVRRDLTRYIRAKRMKDPIVVGHSMGGFIAFWLAINFPENTGPVIIVDASPALSGDLDEAQKLRERWANATDEEFERAAGGMYRGMAFNRKKLEPFAAQAAKSDRRTLGDAIFEMMTTNLLPQVKEIQAPVLILMVDGYFRTRITTQTEPIPNKKRVVFKTGHFLMIDDPEGFVREVKAFLEDQPSD